MWARWRPLYAVSRCTDSQYSAASSFPTGATAGCFTDRSGTNETRPVTLSFQEVLTTSRSETQSSPLSQRTAQGKSPY